MGRIVAMMCQIKAWPGDRVRLSSVFSSKGINQENFLKTAGNTVNIMKKNGSR
jgi:hypothetical protein